MRWLLAFALFTACSSSSSKPTDAAAESSVDPCLTCANGQICVARYDGTCGVQTDCVAKTVDCAVTAAACSPACEAAYCPSPYQCHNRPPCGGESPHAFTCYGP